eukprot:279421-Rhodomonas_salina.1
MHVSSLQELRAVTIEHQQAFIRFRINAVARYPEAGSKHGSKVSTRTVMSCTSLGRAEGQRNQRQAYSASAQLFCESLIVWGSRVPGGAVYTAGGVDAGRRHDLYPRGFA